MMFLAHAGSSGISHAMPTFSPLDPHIERLDRLQTLLPLPLEGAGDLLVKQGWLASRHRSILSRPYVSRVHPQERWAENFARTTRRCREAELVQRTLQNERLTLIPQMCAKTSPRATSKLFENIYLRTMSTYIQKHETWSMKLTKNQGSSRKITTSERCI